MLPQLFAVYVSLELGFWMYLRHRLCVMLNDLTAPQPHPRSPRESMELLLGHMETVKEYYPVSLFLSRWFRGSPVEQVRRGNLEDLLAWSVYARHHCKLQSEEERELVRQAVERVELVLGYCLPPGKTPGLHPCWMTLEPLDVLHMPLFYHLTLWLLHVLTSGLLLLLGFKRKRHGRIVYWHKERRKRTSEAEPLLPLLFFHGVGVGLIPYFLVIPALSRGRVTVLFESPHIHLALGCFRPPSRRDTVNTVEAICAQHGIAGAMVVGHSFGSIKAGWLATDKPHLVRQIVLLDPVSILLTLPDVCYNFLYRPPGHWYEHVIRHLGAKSVTVSNAIRRHFWWWENVLEVERLHCPLLVVLAGNDEVGPATAVREYLWRMTCKGGAPEIEVHWLEGYSHGQCLFDLRVIRKIVSATQKFGLRTSKIGTERELAARS